MEAIKQKPLELFLCKRFNIKLTVDACKQYRQARDQCKKCDQVDASGYPKAINLEEVKHCHRCKTLVIGRLHKDMCGSCAGKEYRAEQKRKVNDLMQQVQVQEKKNIKPNGYNNFTIVLDFSDYQNLFEQIKQKAKDDFRDIGQELIYWAWEFCGNNLPKAKG